MSKDEYYLLYVLSKPPVPVAKPASHNWKTGDVLLAQSKGFPINERFLILDVDHDGQLMALQLSDEPKKDEPAVHCFYLGLDELEGSVPDFALRIPIQNLSNCSIASQWVRLDKVCFGHNIIPKEGVPHTLQLDGVFSQLSLAKVRGALLALWLETTKSTPEHSLIAQARVVETTITTGYQLQRFLDFIELSFDEIDYTLIRDFLFLPKVDIKKPASLDCDCEEHQTKRNSELPYTYAPKNFLSRTWLKMVDCAKKLELQGEPSEILKKLSETACCLKWQPGSLVAHAVTPRPCYIQQLPTELLLSIIESIPLHWERGALLNFGLTCKFFYQLVNVNLYTSIAISCKEEKWDKVVKMLPKHGHLTREIYLEAPLYDDNLLRRVVFDNLRAIGDYCPNLERLDLNYPMRLDLTATEADLPPKLIRESQMQQIEQQADEVEFEATAPEDQEMGGNDDDENAAEHAVQDNHGEDEDSNSDSDDDDNAADHVVPMEANGGDNNVNEQLPTIDEAARAYAAQQAARAAAYEAQRARQKRVCAEIDYIIKNCPLLNSFSLQWTGEPALYRFYHKIPKLKGLRLWDRNVTDQTLIATGTNCRDLERFYFDGQGAFSISLNGLIGMLNALHTKKKSKLKRLGLFHPSPFRFVGEPAVGGMMDDFDDDDDEGMDEDDPMGEMDEDDGDGEGNEAPPPPVVPPPAQPRYDVSQSPLYKYLDVLSVKHPFLERLALIGCVITDDIIPILGHFEHLQSLDLHQPLIQNPDFQGLSAIGCTRLVEVFQGRRLSSLDLSGHRQMSEDDMNILTGLEGLKSLRYIRVANCPNLRNKYLCDEWVQPDDLVQEGGTWRPRDGAGKGALEIGDGWKEQWGE